MAQESLEGYKTQLSLQLISYISSSLHFQLLQRWIPWLQSKLIKFQCSELQATAVFLWSIKLSQSEIMKPPHFTNLSFWEEELHRTALTPFSPLQDQNLSPFCIVPDDFSSLIVSPGIDISVTNN